MEISIKVTITLGGRVSINCTYYTTFSKVLCLLSNSLPLSGQPYANHLWKPCSEKKMNRPEIILLVCTMLNDVDKGFSLCGNQIL